MEWDPAESPVVVNVAVLLVRVPVPRVFAAVMERAATESPDAVIAAAPLFSVPVPKMFAPSLKVTVPAVFAGKTDAVRVMFCPKVDGLADEVSPVVVVA
jgi:hypothetical protein